MRVMLVDDEPDIRTILTHLLQPSFEVVSASNGLEALERLDRYEPDLIVMDVMMPVLDGFDTTRAVKKDTRFSNVPVLFLTARKDNQSVRDALLSGGEMYLEKPFSPPELTLRVNDIIAKHKVSPRPKRYSVAEVEAFYANAPALPGMQAPARPDSAGITAAAAVPGPPGVKASPGTQDLKTATPAPEPRARVLMVDDDPDVLDLARSILEQEYEVITTSDSEASLDKIVAYQPDVLLLDVTMPKLNGFHLAQLIRLNRRLRGANIVFVSSRTDRESVERAFHLGACEFVEKPFSNDHLLRKVEEITRRPEFQRSRKRLDWREIQRREGIVPKP